MITETNITDSRYIGTIEERDYRDRLRAPNLKAHISIMHLLGKVEQCDIGKRIYWDKRGVAGFEKNFRK